MAEVRKYPEWFLPIAEKVRPLLKLPGTMQRFRDMVKIYWEEHRRQIDEQKYWDQRRTEYFAKKVVGMVKRKCKTGERRRLEYFATKVTASRARLRDEAAGPPEEGWRFEYCRVYDAEGSMLVSGWCPPDLIEHARPRVDSLVSFCDCSDLPDFESDPDRQLSKSEKYTICAVIHDVVYRGFEKINSQDDKDADFVASIIMAIERDSLCEQVSRLHDGDRHIVEAILVDVNADLTSTLKRDGDEQPSLLDYEAPVHMESDLAPASVSDSNIDQPPSIEYKVQAQMPGSITEKRLPLGKNASLVYELLKELPEHRAMTGSEICDALMNAHSVSLDESTFRKTVVPALMPYGIEHIKRIGYRIRPDSRPPSQQSA
jgi:hypothetical protein